MNRSYMAGKGDNRDGVVVESGGVVHASIRRRFEELLCELWSEIRVCSRPVPPMLGDASEVDLYKLFMVVKGKGGFDVVCESKLWDSVSEDSGLDSSVGSAVKLIYCKYISALVDDKGKFGKWLTELMQSNVEGLLIGGVEKRCLVSDDEDGESSSRKRKRDFLSGVLNCVAEMAKNPCNPAVVSLPKKSKRKSCGNQKVWKQVLKLRKAVFFKKRFDSRIEEHNWKNEMMHPFMYRGSYNHSLLSKDLDRTPSPKSLDEALKRDAYEAGISEWPELVVPVSPVFQAEIPEWTDITSQSDFKELGTPLH